MTGGRLRAVPHGVARLFARDRSLAGRLPTPVFIRLVYEIMLRRAPDGPGKDLYTAALRSGTLSRTAMLDHVRGSMEFRAHVGFADLLVSLHHSRCDFIRSLPPARRILDLGGTDQGSRDGALVSMGYPYDFEELVIVDLPVELRHELYRSVPEADTVLTHRGPVRYRAGSMVDLSEFPDGSFDLVYSGQTIEHVTSDDCDRTLAEIRRVLRPGGTFAVDTPNGLVCRVQTPEMINPDHKVEYSHAEFAAKLAAAGMTVVEAKGLNYCGPARAQGVFDDYYAAQHHGIFAAIDDCYLLAYVATSAVESAATCVGSAEVASDHPRSGPAPHRAVHPWAAAVSLVASVVLALAIAAFPVAAIPVRAAAIASTPGHSSVTQVANPQVPANVAIVKATGDYLNGWISFTATTAAYSDPLTDPAWANGASSVEWGFSNNAGLQGYQVTLNVHNGVLGASLRDFETRTQQWTVLSCPVTASAAAGFGYAVSIPATCVGAGYSPFTWAVETLRQTPAGVTIASDQAPEGSGASVALADATVPSGYWLVGADGGVFSYGAATFHGSEGGARLNAPIVSAAATNDRTGYWEVAADGGIFSFGDAAFYGSTGSLHLNAPIVALAPTPDDRGYWLIARDGGVFAFGDAAFYGSTGGFHLNQPVVGGFSSLTGHGYTLVAADGGIFSFGDATFHGSTGSLHLNAPIVTAFPTTTGGGYTLVASDGGTFTFGDAIFRGSAAGTHLNHPITAAEASQDGYRLTASDGGVFTFNVDYNGSAGNTHLNAPIVAILPAD